MFCCANKPILGSHNSVLLEGLQHDGAVRVQVLMGDPCAGIDLKEQRSKGFSTAGGTPNVVYSLPKYKHLPCLLCEVLFSACLEAMCRRNSSFYFDLAVYGGGNILQASAHSA